MPSEKPAAGGKTLTVESFLERIDTIYNGLSPAQQKVTLYIRKKWEQICMMTAKEVAQKAEVSEATVQRIAVCLGFKSFRDMKMKIRGSLLKNRAIVNFKLKDGQKENKAGLLDEHVSMEASNILQTFRMNRDEAFQRGASLLINAGRIWVLGDKMGSGVSAYLAFSLNYLIGKAVLLNLSTCDEYLSSMDSGDVLILVGFQRYSAKTLKAARIAKDSGAKILALTDCSLSPFAKLADAAFFAQTESVIFLDSYSAALSLSHALLVAVVAQDQPGIQCRIQKNEQVYQAVNKSNQSS